MRKSTTRRRSGRVAALGAALAALLPLGTVAHAATPTAAQHRPPVQPRVSDLTMTPGGGCAQGQPDQHAADRAPELSAVIRDPDVTGPGDSAESVKAQFQVSWTAADGTAESRTVTTAATHTRWQEGDDIGWAPFRYTVGEDLPGDGTGAFTVPEGVPVDWRVRGGDDTAWGPWSDEGTGTRCQFLLDTTPPEAPAVTSEEYPDDDAWHEGAGEEGTFTFYSPDPDIAEYRYEFVGDGVRTVAPEEPGSPAVVRWTPPHDGLWTLLVDAVDRAGNATRADTYQLLVDKGATPPEQPQANRQLAYWTLDGPAQDGVLAENNGGTPLTMHGGASVYRTDDSCDPTQDPDCLPLPAPLWGEGHLALDGTDGWAGRAPGLLKNGTGFTIGVRVRPSDVTSDRDETVLSLPGSNADALTLRRDGDRNRWQLTLTGGDSADAGVVELTAEGSQPNPENLGDQLTVVHDAAAGDVLLYVNGRQAGDPLHWDNDWDLSAVGLQAGRSGTGAGRDHLSGAVDEIRVNEGPMDSGTVALFSFLASGSDFGEPAAG